MQPPLIWVLTDDRPGNASQALGVAEALHRPFVEKKISYGPLAKLPNALRGATLMGLADDSKTTLTEPWPDVVVAAGRRTAPVSRWIKQQAQEKAGKPVIMAHVMNPGKAGAADFDLIAVPNHDCTVPGGDPPNMLRITGAPHRMTPARLEAEAAAWTPNITGIPRPFIALLVGGATRKRPFPIEFAGDLGRKVRRMASEVGGSVLLSTSRRTGIAAEKMLEAMVREPRTIYLWGSADKTQTRQNPFAGFLALADAVVVTGDSVSMCSEACATPGPVYIFAPEGFVAPKHARLHAELYERGYARPFTGTFEDWRHPALNPAGDVAHAVDQLIRQRF